MNCALPVELFRSPPKQAIALSVTTDERLTVIPDVPVCVAAVVEPVVVQVALGVVPSVVYASVAPLVLLAMVTVVAGEANPRGTPFGLNVGVAACGALASAMMKHSPEVEPELVMVAV